jgi:hypothetical protein
MFSCWLFTYITLIELQYCSKMRNTISFTIKIMLYFQNKINFVPHLFFSHTFINNTSCINIYLKEQRSKDLKKSYLGYFTFYNKTGLHHKAKVILFIISQIKIYWLNVSISSFFYQNKTFSGRWKGEASSIVFFVVVVRGCKIILQITSRWT